MANDNSLAALSTEKIIKRRNLLKGVLTGFSLMWLVLIALAVYFYVTKSNAKLFIPLAVFPMTLLPLFLQLKTLHSELKKREQK